MAMLVVEDDSAAPATDNGPLAAHAALRRHVPGLRRGSAGRDLCARFAWDHGRRGHHPPWRGAWRAQDTVRARDAVRSRCRILPNLPIPPNVPPAVVHVMQSSAGQEFLRLVETQQRVDELHQLEIESAIALGIMAILSALLGWLVAGRVLRPLRTITTAAATDLGGQPPSPARPARPTRRAQDTGGHDRRAARASGGGFRVSATICRQRFTRVAHPAHHDAHRTGRRDRQAAPVRRSRS